MGNSAIVVEGLGKQFKIGLARNGGFSLQQALLDAFRDPFRRLIRGAGSRTPVNWEPFWALKDVSFEVRHGEVTGIIGRNGSGKSTLLKILSRIIEPTTGRAIVRGRVGSLLEVGMGFHPELTGRENVYLSGAVLGMGKTEIDKRFDEIVAFSGVEAFIDTPVKRYSSGMYVRLAFSVAAQMEPDVLFIDEVLAVGDQIFQKRCLQRMDLLAREGRTVLFVSHFMPSVRHLCNTAILLEHGLLKAQGAVDQVADIYMGVIDSEMTVGRAIENLSDAPGLIATLPPDPVFRLKEISVLQDGRPTLEVVNGRPLRLRIGYEVLQDTPGLFVLFRLYGHTGVLIFESIHNGDHQDLPIMRTGSYVSEAEIPADFLAPAPYELWVGAAIHNVRACLPEMIRFFLNVQPGGRVNIAYPSRRIKGEIAPLLRWTTKTLVEQKADGTEQERLSPPIPEAVWEDPDAAPGNERFGMRSVRIRDREGALTGHIDCREAFDVEIEFWNFTDHSEPLATLMVFDETDVCLLTASSDRSDGGRCTELRKGLFRTVCRVKENLFTAGRLRFSVIIWENGDGRELRVDGVVTLDVNDTGRSAKGYFSRDNATRLWLPLQWHTEKVQEDPVPETVWDDPLTAPGNNVFRLYCVRARGRDGQVAGHLVQDELVTIEIEYWIGVHNFDLLTAIIFHNSTNESSVAYLQDAEQPCGGKPRPSCLYRMSCTVPENSLATGRVTISVLIWSDEAAEPVKVIDVLNIDVLLPIASPSVDEETRRALPANPVFRWMLDKVDWPTLPERVWANRFTAPGNHNVSVHAMRIRRSCGEIAGSVALGEAFEVEIEFWNLQHGVPLNAALSVHDPFNNCLLMSANNRDKEWLGAPKPKGLYRCICMVPGRLLGPGRYYMTAHLWSEGYCEELQIPCAVSVDVCDESGRAVPSSSLDAELCTVRPLLTWRTEQIA